MDRKKNLQYFKQKLRNHLSDSFPQHADDTRLINQRAKWAFNAYDGALIAKNPEHQSLEIAEYILLEGFHFSKFDTVLEVVCNEFSELLSADERRPFSLKLLPFCEEVFARFELTDDFAYKIEHDRLYRELKELIRIKLIEYGVQ